MADSNSSSAWAAMQAVLASSVSSDVTLLMWPLVAGDFCVFDTRRETYSGKASP